MGTVYPTLSYDEDGENTLMEMTVAHLILPAIVGVADRLAVRLAQGRVLHSCCGNSLWDALGYEGRCEDPRRGHSFFCATGRGNGACEACQGRTELP